jgi:hypothetical protein
MATNPSRLFRLLLACLLVGACSQAAASAQEAADDRSKLQLKIMEDTIKGFRATPGAGLKPTALTFGSKPLLRYSDPTRGTTALNVLLDAGVWRVGEKGRPTALVTLEIYRGADENATLSYEFLSLTDSPFSLAHADRENVAWKAKGPGLKMLALGDAPKPATSTNARLTQMRQLARQFNVKERIGDVDIDCRLLSQPIDRYQDGEIADGALFVFANGTNPEIGLFLEATETGWMYGLARLSAAQTTISLNDKQIAQFPFGAFELVKAGPYASTSHPIVVGK